MDPGWYFVMTHSSVDYATDGLTEECEPEMVQVAVLVLAANAVALSRRNKKTQILDCVPSALHPYSAADTCPLLPRNPRSDPPSLVLLQGKVRKLSPKFSLRCYYVLGHSRSSSHWIVLEETSCCTREGTEP